MLGHGDDTVNMVHEVGPATERPEGARTCSANRQGTVLSTDWFGQPYVLRST